MKKALWAIAAGIAAVAAYLALRPDRASCEDLSSAGAVRRGSACVVDGPLLLEATHWKALPDDLTVHGNLQIKGTSIRRLPSRLTVDGNLDLYKTSIEQLPADLVVGGDFDSYLGWGSPAIACADIPKTVVIKGQMRGCTQ
jgi:hypothetical protein